MVANPYLAYGQLSHLFDRKPRAPAGVHPSAVIAPDALVDSTASIGPGVVIESAAQIAAGVTIGAHCVIEGHTRIGRDNRIFQFASIGAAPQDKKYAGEPTRLPNLHVGAIGALPPALLAAGPAPPTCN